MTAPHDKLAKGNRVRLTFEGDVTDVSSLTWWPVTFDGDSAPTLWIRPDDRAKPQIERIELPLQIGGHVRGREIVNSQREGVIIAIHGGEAWVSWAPSAYNMAEKSTAFLSDLERIA